MPSDALPTTREQRLAAALAPFAAEGRKWWGTNPVHDGLTLICGEDWPLAQRGLREAEFTIGDLKRAAEALNGG